MTGCWYHLIKLSITAQWRIYFMESNCTSPYTLLCAFMASIISYITFNLLNKSLCMSLIDNTKQSHFAQLQDDNETLVVKDASPSQNKALMNIAWFLSATISLITQVLVNQQMELWPSTGQYWVSDDWRSCKPSTLICNCTWQLL